MTWVNWSCCVVIGGFAVYVLLRLIYFGHMLSSVLEKFEDINETRRSYTEGVEINGDIKNQVFSENRINQAELENNREKYYKLYAGYVADSQFIPLFPLMGIFGTVLGLILGGLDADKLLEGLSLALVTTLVGLIASIVLKIVDPLLVGKKVNLIDSEFDKADAIVSRQIIISTIRVATNTMRS